MDLDDFEAPVAVWKAVEGDRSELIALLRSDARLTRGTRDELADWLEGKLKPVKVPRGRPPDKLSAERVSLRRRFGHDLYTRLGAAGFKFDRLRKFIRKKGWNRKSAGGRYWPTERLLGEVARRFGINEVTFGDYLRRGKGRPSKPRQYNPGKAFLEMRIEIARQIRRK